MNSWVVLAVSSAISVVVMVISGLLRQSVNELERRIGDTDKKATDAGESNRDIESRVVRLETSVAHAGNTIDEIKTGQAQIISRIAEIHEVLVRHAAEEASVIQQMSRYIEGGSVSGFPPARSPSKSRY